MASTIAAPTAPKRKRTPKPAPTTCRLMLIIGGTTYTVRPVPSALYGRAYRLRKADGTAYHVTQDQNGHACDCGDFAWRHEGRGTACKHVRALLACLLLDAAPTSPAAEGGTT
jgi:hypothetical protein